MKNIVYDFSTQVIEQYPMHANFLNASLKNISPSTRQQLEEYFAYCIANGLTLKYLVDSYITITMDTQFEQLYFIQNKKYRWSKFSEVAEKVYFDGEYMRKYMYGLALTSFLWPNHAAVHDFFMATFPQKIAGTYLEIGPGHGYYFMQAAKLGEFDKLLGVDISATSLALTLDILSYFNICEKSKVDLFQGDFLSFDASKETYSCIVMGEVLEHVEDPGRFLSTIATISNTNTHIYVTTCINAPAVDHIYLFRNPLEIEDMVEKNGLAVVDKYYAPYGKLSVNESITQELPINVAYILRKK